MDTYNVLLQSFERFYLAALDKVPNFLVALVVFAAALVARTIVHRTAHVVLSKKTRRRVLIARVVETLIVVVGAIAALGLLGISPTGLLTGVGLLTVGVSFAMQDLIVNFVAGLELLSQAPFELGDHVIVGDVHGRIRSIESRVTIFESDDGRLVTVPNRDLLTKSVSVQRRTKRPPPTGGAGTS